MLRSLTLFFVLAFAGCTGTALIGSGPQRIVFFGDSITELGVKPGGYVTLISDSLKRTYGANAPEVVGAGVSGNKITDLQARVDRDVLQKKPTIVVIYIGINDVWHFALPGLKGTPRDDFDRDLTELIKEIQNAGARVILCTPSVIGEKKDLSNPQDRELDEYAETSRTVAKATGSVLCDLRKDFVEFLQTHNPGNLEKGILTVDRVHLNATGNEFVAQKILRALEEL